MASLPVPILIADAKRFAQVIAELEKASGAAKKFREVFEGIISGETTAGRIDALITDIEGLLAIAEAITSRVENKK